MEAFVDIRTSRRLADGMQIQAAQIGFETVKGFEMRSRPARPVREPRPGMRYLYEGLIHAGQ